MMERTPEKEGLLGYEPDNLLKELGDSAMNATDWIKASTVPACARTGQSQVPGSWRDDIQIAAVECAGWATQKRTQPPVMTCHAA